MREGRGERRERRGASSDERGERRGRERTEEREVGGERRERRGERMTLDLSSLIRVARRVSLSSLCTCHVSAFRVVDPIPKAGNTNRHVRFEKKWSHAAEAPSTVCMKDNKRISLLK